MAVYIPYPGAMPIGPFTISDAGLRQIQALLYPSVAQRLGLLGPIDPNRTLAGSPIFGEPRRPRRAACRDGGRASSERRRRRATRHRLPLPLDTLRSLPPRAAPAATRSASRPPPPRLARTLVRQIAIRRRGPTTTPRRGQVSDACAYPRSSARQHADAASRPHRPRCRPHPGLRNPNTPGNVPGRPRPPRHAARLNDNPNPGADRSYAAPLTTPTPAPGQKTRVRSRALTPRVAARRTIG